jgi:hypothetical protein
MLICRLVRGMLSDAADHRLPWWKRAFVRSHLAICRPCSRVDASLLRTLDILGELGKVPPAGPDSPPDTTPR